MAWLQIQVLCLIEEQVMMILAMAGGLVEKKLLAYVMVLGYDMKERITTFLVFWFILLEELLPSYAKTKHRLSDSFGNLYLTLFPSI